MAVALSDLPRFLVLNPLATVRLEIRLAAPACEIDVALENPKPGRSFVLLIGHKNGPFVQRVRLSGEARVYFDPQAPGEYVMLAANPQEEPIVLRIKARDVPAVPAKRPKPKKRAGPRATTGDGAGRRDRRGTRAKSARPRTPEGR